MSILCIPLGCGWRAPSAQQHGGPCRGPKAEGWEERLFDLGMSGSLSTLEIKGGAQTTCHPRKTEGHDIMNKT